MGESCSRWNDLNIVFKQGNSSLLNTVGALCIIFDDFRLESDALIDMRDVPVSKAAEFRQFYFVRRLFVTLNAYRECLNKLYGNPKYKAHRPFIPTEQLSHMDEAHSYLNKNDVLRSFRNDLGAHVNPELVKAAIEHYGPNAASSVGWESNEEAFTLKLPFAADLLRGAFASTLPGGTAELQTEMEAFFTVTTEAMKRIAHATYALILVFLWDSFGRG